MTECCWPTVGDHRHHSRQKRDELNTAVSPATWTNATRPDDGPSPDAQDVAEEMERVKWHQVQDERKQLVTDNCKRDMMTLERALNRTSKSGYDFLDLALVDESHKIIYCAAPKVICILGFPDRFHRLSECLRSFQVDAIHSFFVTMIIKSKTFFKNFFKK